MNNDAIIQVENLGKRYRIAHQANGQRYVALRDVLTERGKNLFRRDGGGSAPTREDFWALRDVSFEVKRGEVLGIIGRNGAGKTTLLKILSRITEPTEGRVRIRGRVASLLEVGTGFHPELTGRENIFLNGAILGMTKAEIRKKFDEIVAFAETEKFLDTPVKRYSSGMYVRLAFAVAAHLEPEILVVDEVLAVGDAEFQKKCLGKMESVATREGRTVLFVSHNMAAMTALTKSAILLEKGKLVMKGETPSVVEGYQKSWAVGEGERFRRISTGEHSRIESAALVCRSGEPTPTYNFGEEFRVRVNVWTDGFPNLSLDLMLSSLSGQKLAMASTAHFERQLLPREAGTYVCDLVFAPINLASGTYTLDVITAQVNQKWDDYVEAAIAFDVPYSAPNESSYDFQYSRGYGAIALLCRDKPEFVPVGAASQSNRLVDTHGT